MVADASSTRTEFRTPGDSAGPEPQPAPPPFPPNADPAARTRGGVRRMIASATRLAGIQARIILLQTKLTVKRILVAAALWAAAGVVGILALIFLYIAVYRIFTEVIGLAPAWTMLIYALAHIAIAGGLALWAKSIFKKPLPGNAAPKEGSPSPPAAR